MKTQISILLLSSKTRKHFQLLIGSLLVFAIVDGIAIIGWPLIYLVSTYF